MNLDLCENHKQEWKQSHYAEHNCDYCKLKGINAELVKSLEATVAHFRELNGSEGGLRPSEVFVLRQVQGVIAKAKAL